MAVITQRRAKVAYTISGNSPQVVKVPEAASQSFKAGEFVYLASGKAAICADDATTIYGMAVHDASGTTDDDVEVYVANKDTVFEANVYHSTAESAVTAITQRCTKYGLQVDSEMSFVDIEDETNLAFQVIDLSPRDKVGDQYGRVLFQVLDSVSQSSYDLDTDT